MMEEKALGNEDINIALNKADENELLEVPCCQVQSTFGRELHNQLLKEVKNRFVA